MFKRLGDKIKNFNLRKFINKTFKVCFHKFENKESENQFGKFEFEECVCCHKTKNSKLISTEKATVKLDYSQTREDRLSKILDK